MEEKIESTNEENATVESSEKAVEGDILGLYEQIQKITDERDQLQQQVLRTMADFQNFRKRTQAETSQLRQFATEALVRDLLPVLDNFERTLAHVETGASIESLVDGIRAVERQLRQALDSQGVKRLEVLGQSFDPTYHEALGMDEGTDKPSETVTLEIEPGYMIADKVIRPAKVRVAK